MKRILYALCIFMLALSVNAANKLPGSLAGGLIPSKFSRNALTVVVLDNHCNYISDVKQASGSIVIPEKYDDNSVSLTTITAGSTKDDILTAINQSELGNHILSTWFARSPEGEFNMALIAKRGLYNATADDMIKASASKIGMDKIRDAGKVLVDNSYVQIIALKDVISMTEYYDRQDAANYKYAKANNTEYKPVRRDKNGWKASVESHLYKIDPSYVDALFNDMWIYNDDSPEVKAQKRALFDNARFTFTYVMTATGDADGTQDNANPLNNLPVQKNREALFAQLLNSGVKSTLYDMESKYEPFRIKTPLYATKPLGAKIGTKEGLGTDQRFFVMENIMDAKGKIQAKRQGVILVKKVENNSVVASTQNIPLSKFYQTAGKYLELGMTLQQRNDYGVGLSMGAGGAGMGGFYVKAEGNLATISRMVPGINNLIAITQLKVFGSVAFDSDQDGLNPATFMRYQIGVSKGFYFMRNFSLVPFIAYGSEKASLDNAVYDNLNGDFLNVGAYLTMNILYNLQLVTTLNIHNLIGSAYYVDEDDVTTTLSNPYDYYFDGRSGLGIEFGLRYEF